MELVGTRFNSNITTSHSLHITLSSVSGNKVEMLQYSCMLTACTYLVRGQLYLNSEIIGSGGGRIKRDGRCVGRRWRRDMLASLRKQTHIDNIANFLMTKFSLACKFNVLIVSPLQN